jgi:BON domain-containing protein
MNPYLVQHIQDALASDPRARELGVDAQVVGDHVVLTGTVATPELREAIGVVVGEVVEREGGHEGGGELDVVNELAVMSTGDDGSVEELT